MNNLEFKIDTQRILKLLANDIYDSPYALLRENVQNAFDAILMRRQKEQFEGKIDIAIQNGQISIEDNGIGMSADVIEQNYWKAGSSGKNNPEARKAGVVGTFGIGAMANFGICTELKIITRYYEGEQTYESKAVRERLEIGKRCIELQEVEKRQEPGTTVYATLQPGIYLNIEEAKSYLQQFVRYIDVPVFLNGGVISCQKYYEPQKYEKDTYIHEVVTNRREFSYDLDLYVSNKNEGRVAIYISKIIQNGASLDGDVFLEQNAGVPIQGLRRGFGLASLPIGTTFNLGGVANLSFLVPTAGRDSINVESVDTAGRLIASAEQVIASKIASLDICDHNTCFLNYVNNYGRYDLAGNIRINISGVDDFFKLGELSPDMNDKKVYYYTGTDKALIAQYSGDNTILLLPSRDYPRRNIQLMMLRQRKIEAVSDSAQVLKVYNTEEITINEFAFLLRLTSFLKDDYLIPDSKAYFAELSHSVTCIVKKEGEILKLYIARGTDSVKSVLAIYDSDSRLFDGFVKDYIRNYIYQQVAQYVPSSQREGADALYKILQRNKELYTIEKYERGEIEELMRDYIVGNRDYADVLRASEDIMKTHEQTVETNQVGTIEKEMPDIVATNTITNETPKQDPGLATPPILMTDNNTEMKILKTGQSYPQLNGYTSFLALSDRLFDSQADFFYSPHSSRVIWGMHKIVYIFTHASSMLTLYYEIELKHKLSEHTTGGIPIPTTTIITKNRIFVPLIPELAPYFDFKGEPLSFYVKFDLIPDFNDRNDVGIKG